MATKCLILGCSHANGANMHLDPDAGYKHHNFVKQVEYGAKNSYPVLLAEMLGHYPLNYSVSGGSNDAMLRIGLEQINTLSSNDAIIACWTGMDRGEIWHEEHQYWRHINFNHLNHQLVPNEFSKTGINIGLLVDRAQEYFDYAKQWLLFEGNYVRGYNNKLKNVLALNSIAHSRGIKLINLDSFEAIWDFDWPDSVYRPQKSVNDEFCSFAINNNFPHEPDGHFFRPAHLAYAEYIYSIVEDKTR
jgi:hypothetical protein